MNETFTIDFAANGSFALPGELRKNDAALKQNMPDHTLRFPAFVGDRQNELLFKFDQYLYRLENQLETSVSAEPLAVNLDALSPLVIYGPSYTAKTLLAISFAQRMQRLLSVNGEDQSVSQVSCSDFVRQFGQAQHTKSIDDFRHHFSRPKIIIFDDLHMLAGRTHPIHELESVLERMIENRQIGIFTARQTPWKINHLGKRLISRLSVGTILPVHQPGRLARQEIVERFSSLFETSLSLKQLKPLYDDQSGSFADIQKRFHQIQFNQLPSNSNQTIELIDNIISVTAREFSLRPIDIKGPSRQRTVSTARNICIYLIRNHVGMSFQQIGSLFGGRDHSTIIHACKKCNSLVESDEAIMNSVQQIKNQIFSED